MIPVGIDKEIKLLVGSNKGIDHFQEKAYDYAKDYDRTRSSREIFTYNITASAEEYHAKRAVNTAENFITTVRQVMISR